LASDLWTRCGDSPTLSVLGVSLRRLQCRPDEATDEKCDKQCGKPARYSRLLVGDTKAAQRSESAIHAIEFRLSARDLGGKARPIGLDLRFQLRGALPNSLKSYRNIGIAVILFSCHLKPNGRIYFSLDPSDMPLGPAIHWKIVPAGESRQTTRQVVGGRSIHP